MQLPTQGARKAPCQKQPEPEPLAERLGGEERLAEPRQELTVDPLATTLEVLGAAGRWREVQVHQGDVRVRAAPFEAIELDLTALWGAPGVTS